MKIADIKVGVRHRKDMGDIEALARSIREVGLLHPIVVRKDGTLIAGERRLKACGMLGMSIIDVTVVDIAQIARGEHAENIVRKDFTLSEAVAIADALEPEEKLAAKERMTHGGRGKRGAKLSPDIKGKTRDKVAAATGKKKSTLAKARDVVRAAQADPDKFGKLQEDMDRTGNANGPFKRLKVMRQAAAIRAEPPPLPGNGPYRVIIADPPWPYEIRKADPTHRATHPYPQMSIADIIGTDLDAIAHKDCILWLWTTNHHMKEALEIAVSWGFEVKTILTWGKNRFGTGDWLRGQTEHCLLAVRGKPTVEIKNHSTLLLAAMRKNSEKPSEFYDLVESHSPAPRYAYLWSRMKRKNWDCHGDEVPS